MKLSDATFGRNPAALLLDLDGTLIDSAPDLAQAVDRLLVQLRHAKAGEELVRQWVGNGSRILVQRALAFALSCPGDALEAAAIDAALAIFMGHYANCCTDRSRLYPGVLPALRQWHRDGIVMACVTNKPTRFTKPLLDHFGLAAFLPVAVCGDTLAQRKPDPAPLLFACAQLSQPVARSAMIGDSRNDVLAARAAGMPALCVSYGYNYGQPIALEHPDLVVDSLAELI